MTVPANRRKFELTFAGSALVKFPRYRRHHATYESAEETANHVLFGLENRGSHPAIIYGPGCGASGRTLS